jgi:hypothetical protein
MPKRWISGEAASGVRKHPEHTVKRIVGQPATFAKADLRDPPVLSLRLAQ